MPGFYSVQDMLASGIQIDAASVCTAGVENGGDHYAADDGTAGGGHPGAGRKADLQRHRASAEEMVALAKEKNLRYGINLNHRFTPAARQRERMGQTPAGWARSTSST